MKHIDFGCMGEIVDIFVENEIEYCVILFMVHHMCTIERPRKELQKKIGGHAHVGRTVWVEGINTCGDKQIVITNPTPLIIDDRLRNLISRLPTGVPKED